eukprot:2972572-Pleurochrysis_carterae.AAC.3
MKAPDKCAVLEKPVRRHQHVDVEQFLRRLLGKSKPPYDDVGYFVKQMSSVLKVTFICLRHRSKTARLSPVSNDT